jgi:acetyltransferase-like isoleucine patch superfamily enzyme
VTGEGLRDWWRTAHARVREEFDRSLPLADYVVDRWERARAYGFGEGTSVYDSCLVLGDVTVGEHTWVGPFTVLDGSGGLTIGSHCAVSAGVHLYSHDTVLRTVTAGEAPIEYGRTTIGDRAFLGPHVVVQRGVTVGDGAVIGANSFVTRDIPEGVLAFGSPCRVRGDAPRWRDDDNEGDWS